MCSKPCARPSCPHMIVQDHGPKTFAARKYCSTSCGMRHRREQGWTPAIAPETYRRAGAIGGKASGQVRRKRALLVVVDQIKPILPKWFYVDLDAEQRALVLALIARTGRRMYRLGKKADFEARKAKRQQRQRQEAA